MTMQPGKIAQVVLLGCASFLCVSLGLVALDVRAHLDTTFRQVDVTLGTTQKTALEVNKLLNDMRLTMDNVNRAAIDERRYFEQDVPALTAKLSASLDQANALLASVRDTSQDAGDAIRVASADGTRIAANADLTLATANDTVRGLQPVEAQSAAELVALEHATGDLDKLLSDPALGNTMANAASATGAVNASAQELQAYVHGLLHPTWLQRVWNLVQTVGVDVAKVFVP